MLRLGGQNPMKQAPPPIQTSSTQIPPTPASSTPPSSSFQPPRSPSGRHIFQGASARNRSPKREGRPGKYSPALSMRSTSTGWSQSTSTTPRGQSLKEQDEQKDRVLPTFLLMDREDLMRSAGGREPEESYKVTPWRMKERMKTVQVAIVMCLNIGTDPPDVVKTPPYARDECWIDPLSLPPQKAIERIGQTLQGQYVV